MAKGRAEKPRSGGNEGGMTEVTYNTKIVAIAFFLIWNLIGGLMFLFATMPGRE